MNTNKKIIIGSLMGCVLGATVGYSASVVSLPHTFTAGTPIKASEVNANFLALANSIESLKLNNTFANKSPLFVEENYSSNDTTIGMNINIGNNSYSIRQLDFEDTITGKKYTLKYPSDKKSSYLSLYAANCTASRVYELIVKQINMSGITAYIALSNSLISRQSQSTGVSNGGLIKTEIYFQVGAVCGTLPVENHELLSTDISKYNKIEADKLIMRATELSKYISIREI